MNDVELTKWAKQLVTYAAQAHLAAPLEVAAWPIVQRKAVNTPNSSSRRNTSNMRRTASAHDADEQGDDEVDGDDDQEEEVGVGDGCSGSVGLSEETKRQLSADLQQTLLSAKAEVCVWHHIQTTLGSLADWRVGVLLFILNVQLVQCLFTREGHLRSCATLSPTSPPPNPDPSPPPPAAPTHQATSRIHAHVEAGFLSYLTWTIHITTRQTLQTPQPLPLHPPASPSRQPAISRPT